MKMLVPGGCGFIDSNLIRLSSIQPERSARKKTLSITLLLKKEVSRLIKKPLIFHIIVPTIHQDPISHKEVGFCSFVEVYNRRFV